MRVKFMQVISFGLIFAGIQLASAATSTKQPTLKMLARNVRSSCKADINHYCKSVTPGGGRLADCLNAHEDKLSKTCSNSWTNAKADISRRIDRTEVAFRKSCGSDVQKFCSNVPSGEGRLLDCLSQNKNKLSGSCSQFQAKVDQRLSEIFG